MYHIHGGKRSRCHSFNVNNSLCLWLGTKVGSTSTIATETHLHQADILCTGSVHTETSPSAFNSPYNVDGYLADLRTCHHSTPEHYELQERRCFYLQSTRTQSGDILLELNKYPHCLSLIRLHKKDERTGKKKTDGDCSLMLDCTIKQLKSLLLRKYT